jgi:hypothetical protein
LIVDKYPVHLKVNRRLEQHAERIRLFLLPSYSPELNPDELLNHDVKANAVGRKRAKTKGEMMEHVMSGDDANVASGNERLYNVSSTRNMW